ncbi:MAG TPA: pyruvate kinase [Candidatus Sulfotelmatobacter sp.]|nr:pyruvate kinase [Candidatus Sulfotelmatobacter sp.]
MNFTIGTDHSTRLPPSNLDTLAELFDAISDLRTSVEADSQQIEAEWGLPIERAAFAPSAGNLADYLALRRRDLRSLQVSLMPWGLSSLGRLESRVMPTLDAVVRTLAELTGQAGASLPQRPSAGSFFEGDMLLERNTDEVFGPPPQGRRERIMATLPTEAATDYELVRDLVGRGADSLRINCAHDDQDRWAAMIANGRKAATELGHQIRIDMDLAGQKPRIEEVMAPERRLVAGDRLLLTSAELMAAAAVEFQARCSPSSIVGELEVEVEVSIDDGKVASVVESRGDDWAVLRVTRAPQKGKALRAGLGLNFPGHLVNLPALTSNDLEDLVFVAANADIVGFSFVQSREDVAWLQEELRRHGKMPALMAKIETAQAVRNLPEIIVQAARHQPLAVMIARGDLAVNIGYLRLAEIQEELMWLSEAAHVPVVWATQVLERLVQKGVPSRAEVTDAAMSERAECVMLNKGPHVLDAVTLLDHLLHRMEKHQWKKVPMLRALHAWDQVQAPIDG